MFWVNEVLCSYIYLKILLQFCNFMISFIKLGNQISSREWQNKKTMKRNEESRINAISYFISCRIFGVRRSYRDHVTIRLPCCKRIERSDEHARSYPNFATWTFFVENSDQYSACRTKRAQSYACYIRGLPLECSATAHYHRQL